MTKISSFSAKYSNLFVATSVLLSFIVLLVILYVTKPSKAKSEAKIVSIKFENRGTVQATMHLSNVKLLTTGGDDMLLNQPILSTVASSDTNNNWDHITDDNLLTYAIVPGSAGLSIGLKVPTPISDLRKLDLYTRRTDESGKSVSYFMEINDIVITLVDESGGYFQLPVIDVSNVKQIVQTFDTITHDLPKFYRKVGNASYKFETSQWSNQILRA